jgi:hypothetical protein
MKINCFLIQGFYLFILCFSSIMTFGQASVLTRNNNLYRTGWYTEEQELNINNVKIGSFGKLFSRVVDDQLYTQPLVVLGAEMPLRGKKNVLVLATVSNSVYAYDADSASFSEPYWSVNLTPAGTRPLKKTDLTGACGGGYRDFSDNIGIVGTPVIDSVTNTIYLVARSVNPTTQQFYQYFHALDLLTGQEKPNSPILITAETSGNGEGNINGKIIFDSQKQNQRCGLLMVDDIVYITYASHCDWGPYHGWILGYDKNTLSQQVVYNTTPNGYYGGIWMSGGAPAVDSSGFIYVGVGNGSVGTEDNPGDTINRSESAIKLKRDGNSLKVTSYFTPSNYLELETGDLDFGSTQTLLIPGAKRAVTGGKDGRVYLLNTDDLGGYNPNENKVVQTIDLGLNAHLHATFSYYKGEKKTFVFIWSENALLKALPFDSTTGMFDLENTVNSAEQGPIGNIGANLSLSSKNSIDSTAILWAVYSSNGDANASVRPGILRAFSAADITKELWNSDMFISDNAGNYAKFNCPTIANGKVYLPTFSNQLIVYGLTNATDTCNTPNIALGKEAAASSEKDNSSLSAAAFDGDPTTAWRSTNNDEEFISVDLGRTYDLCRITLEWTTNASRNFNFQLSTNGQDWKELASYSESVEKDLIQNVKDSARYIKLDLTKGGSNNGYELNEFQVFGVPKSSENCGVPFNLNASNIYETAVTLSWEGVADSFHVQIKTVSAGTWQTITTVDNSLTLSNVSCATDYLYKVQAFCAENSVSNYSSAAAFSTLSCNAGCGLLPTRWNTQDIGNVGFAGSACYDQGVFTLKASGQDIFNDKDAFRFAYTTLGGDGSIIIRVLDMEKKEGWSKCGIMMRESLTPGSKHAFIFLTPSNGSTFQVRGETDGSTEVRYRDYAIPAPYWFKLEKKGSEYTAYMSSDGFTWIQTGDAVDIGFGNGVPVYAGIAYTGLSNAFLSTATVDNYQFINDGPLPLQILRFTSHLTLNKTIGLEWVTTSENGIKSFVLERSSNNIQYKEIATVAAENNGEFVETYTYEDKLAPKGTNYYRLRIIGTDGKVTYSPLAVINLTKVASPKLFPNPPSGGVLHIRPGSDPIKFINIYDIAARKVKTLQSVASGGTVDIPIYTLSNGIYFVEIRTSKTRYVERIIIKN